MKFERSPLDISQMPGVFESEDKLFAFPRKEVVIDGVIAGYAELLIDRKAGRGEIKEIRLEKDFRGKGYGKELYTQLGKELASEGVILFSGSLSHRSDAATGVWNSLVRDGLAKEIPDGYEFIGSMQKDEPSEEDSQSI